RFSGNSRLAIFRPEEKPPPSPAGLSSSCRARQFDPGLGRVRAIGLFSFSVPPIDHIAELLCHATRCEAAADKLPGNVGKGLQIIRCDLRSNTPAQTSARTYSGLLPGGESCVLRASPKDLRYLCRQEARAGCAKRGEHRPGIAPPVRQCALQRLLRAAEQRCQCQACPTEY